MENKTKYKRICGLLAAAVAALTALGGCSDNDRIWDIFSPSDDSSESRADDGSSTEGSDSSSDDSSTADSADSQSADDSEADAYPDSSNTKLDAVGLYDTSAISAAYLTGDPSELDDMQKEILAKAVQIIDSCITEDMSPVEKELAIHDYICREYHYDKSALDIFHSVQPHSDDPYGMLVLGRGICSGYTTSFKLLMDMLEIECINVHATANRNDEHAWNLVRLDGEWYCVDVTWDDLDNDDPDPLVSHDFFNVTDGTMLTHSHKWDMSQVPRATGEKYSYPALFTREVGNVDEVMDAVSAAVDRCHDTVLLRPVGSYAKDPERLGEDALDCLVTCAGRGMILDNDDGIVTVQIYQMRPY